MCICKSERVTCALTQKNIYHIERVSFGVVLNIDISHNSKQTTLVNHMRGLNCAIFHTHSKKPKMIPTSATNN